MKISITLESLRPSDQSALNFYASQFDAVLSANSLSEIPALLQEVEKATANGYHAFGFLTYEAGFAFLPNMPSASAVNLPFGWFALTRNLHNALPAPVDGSHEIRHLHLNQNLLQYSKALRKIRSYIERGETYQVNYTLRYRGKFSGDARSLYTRLKQKQSVSYAAFIETPDWTIVSLSPELFFRKKGNRIAMRPMKGTAPRGRFTSEDREQARRLSESSKERAENLMIVDMLRNDLGRICETGTVRVTQAFDVERYETLLQMTSTIHGRLRNAAQLLDIFRSTFPSGSITGAPKIRTMQIVHELEHAPRGIYTGAIGFANADEAVFSVAIRTACIDHSNQIVELGVGSGVLHEADEQREYEECRLKADFFTMPVRPFDLIETILWVPGEGYRNLTYHLERVSDSADYFLFSFKRQALEQKLREHERALMETNDPVRLRVLVNRAGDISIESHPVEQISELPVRVRLASRRQDSGNVFLFHKTTNRSFYAEEYEKAKQEGFFDVIFLNERDEVTEGAITNIFLKKGSTFYTPPLSCGLLAGTFRRGLIEKASFPIEERILYKNDLCEADEIFASNAIRGMLSAKLIE